MCDSKCIAAPARAGLCVHGPGGGECLVHNGADGAGAMTAFGAAAQATVNLRRRAWAVRPRIETGAHIIVRENVTGADDH